MASASIANTQTPARTEYMCDLWETVNQLESVLEVANEDMMAFDSVPQDASEEEKQEVQGLEIRARVMLRIAQKLSAELAQLTGVR